MKAARKSQSWSMGSAYGAGDTARFLPHCHNTPAGASSAPPRASVGFFNIRAMMSPFSRSPAVCVLRRPGFVSMDGCASVASLSEAGAGAVTRVGFLPFLMRNY